MKVRWGLAVVIAAIATVAGVATVAIGRDGGETTMAALAAMVRDPLSLLAMRSPGERGAGALLSSKPPRAAAPEAAPVERVLPTVRERPLPAFPPAAAPPEFVEPFLLPLETLPPEPELLPVGPFRPEFEAPLVEIWLLPPLEPVPPGGGGGGGGGDPPPTIPAPEPATWAMMILGFFTAGFAIRRAGARRAQPAA